MADQKLGLLIILAAVVLLYFLVIMYRDSHRFVTVKYCIQSPKLHKKCRFVLLSDLHNKEYGPGNARLLEAIRAQNPDFILIAGDMLTANEAKTEYMVPLNLLQQLADDYPVYYGMGNHEYRVKVYREAYGDKYDHYKEELKKIGIQTLENDRVFLPEYNIEICGLEIERRYYKRFRRTPMDEQYPKQLLGSSRTDCMEILIAHNPDYFKQYAAWGADLTLSGHVHGGVMRLPVLGGVISPAVHLFPKYDGGIFREYGSTMILSRGLGMHTIPVRIFNPGELVVVDVEKTDA